MQSQMQFRVQKRGYSVLVMIASPLLALALGGVGWATVCQPNARTFLEIDNIANLGFNGNLLGNGEGGSNNLAPCAAASNCPGGTCARFDWANSQANPSGCLPPDSDGRITCTGSGGIFDGGKYLGNTKPPLAPLETMTAASDPTIPVAVFAVDPLGASTEVATHCSATVTRFCDPSLQTNSTAHCNFATATSCTK